MLKSILFLYILLVASLMGLACDCDGDYWYTSEFYHCDVVMSGKVKKVFAETKDSYKIELEISNIYKGDSISEFKVNSIPENFAIIENGDTLIVMSDCDIYLHVGEEWMIYANKRNDGVYGFGFCSATKRLSEVSKEEFYFLDYRKNLKITDDTKYYQTDELDDTNLISLSSRSYPLVINSFVPSELETDNIEVSIRIDKAGRLVYDSLNVENNMAIIREIKSLEPFIPATKNGEIVNAEYKVLIKRE